MYAHTITCLEQFDNQHDFERMCSDILVAQGYKEVVPIAPRGGADGGRAIEFRTESGGRGLACVTLRADIDKKFKEDFWQRQPGEYEKYFLFCKAYLTATQKRQFAIYCLDTLDAEFVPQDIEALRSLLDSSLVHIRERYLPDAGDAAAPRKRDIKLGAEFIIKGTPLTEVRIIRRLVRAPTLHDYQIGLSAAAAELARWVCGPTAMQFQWDALRGTTALYPPSAPVHAELEDLIAHTISTLRLPEGIYGPMRSYLRRYATYLAELHAYTDFRSRSHRVGLRVLNRGSVAAHDVVVEVTAPDARWLRRIGALPPTPREPRRPFLTSIGFLAISREEGLFSEPEDHAAWDEVFPDDAPLLDGSDLPRQEREEPHRLVYDVKRVLHNVPVTLAPFIVVVPVDWSGEPLRLSCKIHADGQPEPAEIHADLVASTTVDLDPWTARHCRP